MIVIDTISEGISPAVYDGQGAPAIFATELEAQREIVDYQMTRLQQFLDGEREFDDAMTVDEFITQVAYTRQAPMTG